VSEATNVKQTTTTNQDGLFQVQSLNPGLYTVTVQKIGFERTTIQSVSVSGIGTTPIDITLATGAVNQSVTVTADSDLLNKTESNVTTTVDHAIVANLPYPERSSLEAALLVPGVVGDPLQPGGISTENPSAYTSYVTPGAGIVIGGAPPGTSSIVVDGSDVTQPSLARTGVNLSGREVQETTVIVTGLSAEYGRTGGGVIVQSSTAGTSALISESGLQLLNSYQNFFNQSISEIYPRGGTMEYNGMYLSVNQRFGAGLSLLANYTWSKTLDNVPDTNTGTNGGGFGYVLPQDPHNPYGEWSVASFDQASRLKIGYTYDLPIGANRYLSLHSRFLDNLIGNISTSGIATYADGLPNAITLGTIGYFVSVTPSGTNGCTTSGSNNYCSANALPTNPGYSIRPNIVPGVPLINKNWKKNALNSSFTPCLNPAAFSVPGSLNDPQLGNAPRLLANMRSPREALFDMHFSKGFKLGERYDLKITGTFINAFNHPVYYGVAHSLLSSNTVSNVTGTVTPVTSASFGQFNQSQTAGMSRVILVGGEFTFKPCDVRE
jgi:hypothetical protein